jgi:sterol desaturase/sphingolipid hydroxylase (fatty acid hydroxylase superfamily)
MTLEALAQLGLAVGFACAAVTLIVALRYLVSSGLFALLTQFARPGLYQGLGKQIRREIHWSLLSAIIYGVPAGATIWVWWNLDATLLYTDFSDYPLWYAPLSLVIYLFAQDSWFYWTHRLMHKPWWFRLAHSVHHDSRPPTAWTAMSFHPIEALSGAILVPLLVWLIPIHVAMLGLVLTIATLMGVTNHMGWEMFPRWLVHSPLGNWLITASHHERHHEEYQCNFGLYFRFWDRVCATDRGLSQRLAGEQAQASQ